jgi:membrane protein
VLTLAFAISTAVALLLVLAGGRMGAFLAGRFGLEQVFAIVWNIGHRLVALVLVLKAVDLLYRFAPLKNRKWKWMTPGGVVALWVLVSLGFRVDLSSILATQHTDRWAL